MTTIEKLYQSLKERLRPEDVAQIIQNLLKDQLAADEFSLLEMAAKNSLIRNVHHYTSMAQTFAKAVGAESQITTAIDLFKLELAENIEFNDFGSIEKFIQTTSAIIHKPYGQSNFVNDRLNKMERKAIGLDISKRNYNKKWRILKRLEKKLMTFAKETRKAEFQMIAKHGLVHNLDYELFTKDLNSACFIAYYNARCNLRSVFTNGSQQRPFDTICEMLLNRCKVNVESSNFLGFGRKKIEKFSPNTNFIAIAHIYPNSEILANLTDSEKGELLGKWTNILQDIANLLAEVWQKSKINRETMIVRRGNDSTTWNNTAGAWNKARDSWMNLIYSMGLDEILEDVCFGKVLRLMTADVAAWHRRSGGGLDPNTEVWNALPLPWEVFENEVVCTKYMVAEKCKSVGLDPEKSGWIAPRVHGIAQYTPTPELVHGVSVSNPFLAKVLKMNKVYSGKYAK